LSFSFRLHFHFVTKTLTKLDLRSNEISDEGAQQLALAFENNKVMLPLSFISIFTLWCRHSPCCVWDTIKSVMKVLNILLVLSKIITSVFVSICLVCLYFHIFIQTLTALDLSYNKIATETAVHLAHGLKNHKVSVFLYISLSVTSLLSYVDAPHTGH
jgi:Ran GTPase-activating protein (RanGAP) involved in mRNA processing and transport